MRIKPISEKPVERSFVQQQLYRNPSAIHPDQIPPLTVEQGLNRDFIYHAITITLDRSKHMMKRPIFIPLLPKSTKPFSRLSQRKRRHKKKMHSDLLCTFFTEILNSNYYETYCRYISVSYFPESLEWWNTNKTKAEEFLNWFEHGDNNKTQ